MAERANPGAGGMQLAILAKAPVAGLAKTRLIPRLGAAGAAALHAVLLERTLRLAAAPGFARVALWCAPDRRAPFFAALDGGALELRDQPAGDLGARMLAVSEHHLAAGSPLVMVGTDCPELAPGHLARARAALAGGADAVLLPAEDGGYAAIGLARVDRALFDDVPWGSAQVLRVTRERLARLGFTWRELSPAVRDVDRPEDVEWLLAGDHLTPAERARIAPYLGAAR